MNWVNALSEHGRLNEQVMMSAHTTLGIGGPARWCFRPSGINALGEALRLIPQDIAILPLGRGSNMLVPDHGFDGVVIDFGDLSQIDIENNRVTTQAGARMGKVAQQCATHGLTGLEFLATVPGDMGGGIAMNAGAFGQQLSDCLDFIRVITRDGASEILSREQLHMSYRHTELPEKALVASATFSLKTDNPEDIRNRMREIRKQRSSTQPLTLPNCGSVFKNPDGDYAARLIEAAGLKGKKIGNARISTAHANFIVNEGGASSADVLKLIKMARQAVQDKFEITLEPEVRILGGMQ